MKLSEAAFKTRLVECLHSKNTLREIYGKQEKAIPCFLQGLRIVLTFLHSDPDQVMKKGMQIVLITKM